MTGNRKPDGEQLRRTALPASVAAAAYPAPGEGVIYDAVHARFLQHFPELVRELGGEPEAMLHQVGIDPQVLAQGRTGATYRQMITLFEQAAAELRCPDFGMRLAMLQRGQSIFGPLGGAMRNSRTLGEALDFVCSHSYAHSLAVCIWQLRGRSGGSVFVGHDILLDQMLNRSQAVEQIMLLGLLAVREITGGHAKVRRVHFRHQPVSPVKNYRRYFDCEVLFGQNEDGVVYYEQDLACPIMAPDPTAYKSAVAYIESRFTRQRPPLQALARGVVTHFLSVGDCTNERVAAELNLHPRTLHRRLKEEGTSFQQVKDEVRREILLYYLRTTDLDLTSIAARLGYAEHSVLTRSCIRWFGVAPSKLRAQARGEPDLEQLG